MKIKWVCCPRCDEYVYQTDGQFVYLDERVLNPVLDEQEFDCPNCNRLLVWHRARKFIGKDNSPPNRNVMIYERKTSKRKSF